MRRLIHSAACAVAALGLLAGSAFALTPRALSPGEPSELAGGRTVRTSNPAAQRRLNASPGWQTFRARHGAWSAVWNELTETPHRAIGRGIPLPGAAANAEAIDASLRSFIAGNGAVFGPGVTLGNAHVQQAGRVWYARYQQMHRGVPLLFADWEFRVSQGKLVAFGADRHVIPDDTPSTPVIPGAVARIAAREGLDGAVIDRVEGGEDLYLLPRLADGAFRYDLVWDVRVHTSDPPGNWITLVDATDGEVLWRMNRVRYSIDGTASGLIHELLPTEVPQSNPFRGMYVRFDGLVVDTTDAAGAYSATPGGAVTVSAELHGPYVNVNRTGAADAALSFPGIADLSTQDFAWSDANSHVAERDGFYHTNVAHTYLKGLDPGFVGNDYEMPCTVNINDTCNAFWNGSGINFFLAGGGCPNTATMPDVVYHEYGHGVNDNLYEQAGSVFGMQSGALHEGLADVLAAFILDDPVVGKGFFGPGTSIRTVDNTNYWPDDASGDGHITGLIVAGAWWDLREAIGLAAAESLSHYSKYGTPDDSDPGVAMNEVFIEALVADDDDADLSNGTPRSTDIIAAFNAHGIGTGFWIDIQHAPIADQTGAGDYAVTTDVVYGSLIGLGALDSASVMLHYSIDGGSFQTVAMSPTGNPDEFEAMIPNQSAAIVRYWIEAADTFGGTNRNPAVAPDALHLFLAGPATEFLVEEMESDPGWSTSLPADDATTGLWEWGVPVGSNVGGVPVAIGEDHTEVGTQCYFTGNALVGQGAGTNDVDGGVTTLTTTVFDATAGGDVKPVIEYYKWYSNDQGASPGQDDWIVSISNDGGSNWTEVENTNVSTDEWTRVVFFIEDYVPPTNDMMLRFVAADLGDGSLVEAAVDDLRLLDFFGIVAVESPTDRMRLSLALPAPNPFRGLTRLRFALPRAGHVALRVFDLQGRAVHTLAGGMMPAGEHFVEWRGQDNGGAMLPNGLYFVQLSHPDGVVRRRVTLMR